MLKNVEENVDIKKPALTAGCHKKTAYEQGVRLLSNVIVKNAIEVEKSRKLFTPFKGT